MWIKDDPVDAGHNVGDGIDSMHTGAESLVTFVQEVLK
jgi:hypothetical protein